MITKKQIDEQGRLQLPRDEIAFRKAYETLVKNGQLTTVFRPGNRVYPSRRGYKPGEIITARIIEVPGNDTLYIPPTFNDIKRIVRITDLEVKLIEELTEDDFIGSSPDLQDITSLKYQLGTIYGKSAEAYTGTDVTKIRLTYL